MTVTVRQPRRVLPVSTASKNQTVVAIQIEFTMNDNLIINAGAFNGILNRNHQK
jgi:hypothetical protein